MEKFPLDLVIPAVVSSPGIGLNGNLSNYPGGLKWVDATLAGPMCLIVNSSPKPCSASIRSRADWICRRYAVRTPIGHFGTSVDQRRSQRILISASIRISGQNPAGAVFEENTSTIVVNSHGGLVLLKEKVSIGQMLTMQHLASQEEIDCLVKGINPEPVGVPEIAIEFQKPHPRFWHISFPPPDWNSRSPEAKRFGKHQSGLVSANPTERGSRHRRLGD